MAKVEVTRADESGFAVVLALAAMVLAGAVAGALLLNTSAEMAIAANFRNSSEALYAVDSAVERVMADLPGADWNQVLAGSMRSSFVDGLPGGTKRLADGTLLDVGRLLNMMNCGKATACADSDMDMVTSDRPWGLNNPRWQPYAYGSISDLRSGDAINSLFYVIVLVADDPSENDGNPLRDGADPGNPGSGVLMLHAEAFGPRRAHRVVEATVAQIGEPPASSGARVLSWRTLR